MKKDEEQGYSYGYTGSSPQQTPYPASGYGYAYGSAPPPYPPQGYHSSEPYATSPHVNAADDVPEDFHYSGTVADASRKIRHRFVLKVYLLLTLQLAITAGFCALFLSIYEIKVWVQQNYWLIWVNLIPTIIVIIVLAFKKRSFPLNIVLLLIFTIFESYTIATITTYYDVDLVLQAFMITAGIFAGLSLFAIQTKWDFSGLAPILFASLFGLLLVGLVSFWFQNEVLDIVYCSLGILIFSGYILYDTQQIFKRLSPEDYVIGAVDLYLDIINLFVLLLRLLGATKR